MPTFRLGNFTLAFLLLASIPLNLSAQERVTHKTVDLGAFTKEVMLLDFSDNHMQLGMWLPFEFFVAAAVSERKMTKTEAEKNLKFLRPYLTLIVQNSLELDDGTSVYADEKEVRARAVLKLSNGVEVNPLVKVPPRITATLAAMKAVISQEGDSGSASMHILVFPAFTPQGEKIVDTSRQDQLTLLLKANPRFKEVSMMWRTPFDATTNVPDCPRCKAGVSAKWSYCPYCGQKLPHQ